MTASSSVFSCLNLLLIQSADFSRENMDSTIKLLADYGAAKTLIYKPGASSREIDKQEFLRKFPMDIHAIIACNIDFSFYRLAAFDFMIPVVTPSWVHSCVKNARLMRTTGFSPDKTHFMKDCYVYVSSQQFSAAEYELYTSMLTYMGGCCMDYLSTKVTHIITSDPKDQAVLVLKRFNKFEVLTVSSAWLAECFVRQEYVSEAAYLVGSEMSNEEVTALAEKDWKMNSGIWEWSFDILKGHQFYLSMNLLLKSQCYNFIIKLIETMGGRVVRYMDHAEFSIEEADCFLDITTSSGDYKSAKEKGLYCGNLNWLFYMLSMRKFIRPASKLLLSPAKPKIFNRKQLILTFTNYIGQQRYYIQRLVESLGGVSTTELSKKNTHLLSLFPHGKKHNTALKWQGCTVVNHLWLEKCYKLGEQVGLDSEQFSQIPVKGGMANSIGQLALEEEPSIVLTETEQMESQVPLSYKLENIPLKDLSVSGGNIAVDGLNEKPQSSPPPRAMEDNYDRLNTVGDKAQKLQEAEDMFSELEKVMSSGSSNRRKNSRTMTKTSTQTAPVVQQTLGRSETADTTLEEVHDKCSVPLTPSSGRKAKAKAAEKLHSDIESLNEFQKSSKRKTVANLLPEEVAVVKKHKSLEIEAQKILAHVDISKGSKGRQKLPYDIKAVCTSCHDDISELNLEILKQIGIVIHQDIKQDSNCIIAPKKARTAKFLKSFSFRPLKYALIPKFINDVLSIVHSGSGASVLLSLEEYHIPDMDLKVMQKTKIQGKLFERGGLKSVNLSDDIPGGAELISSILKAHGMVTVKSLPKKFQVEDIVKNENTDNSPDYVMIATKASVAKRFAKLCKATDKCAKILLIEWNWCVKAIFNLNVDYEDPEFVITSK
ncbi:Rtt107p Ecym_2066 [Eremothecium cymbalariae DBVPG|uniref:BRCT domain-containing protein n=1 Tax=Eremothecium cymbalariae (strain CBS 270.75 / DBVPG 7215 / KCTC 17166 / NRRL Y-17582) TaxID=931890 RepID=G8JP23_ERECY|nr:Hypothetical protein Ecym_2066 [Eremothecium cymbalariae DBVPG\